MCIWILFPLSQAPFLACLYLPQAMAGAGIVSGFDMTSEAALAKLSYVLGQPGLTLDDRKKVCAPLGLLHGFRTCLCAYPCLLTPEASWEGQKEYLCLCFRSGREIPVGSQGHG